MINENLRDQVRNLKSFIDEDLEGYLNCLTFEGKKSALFSYTDRALLCQTLVSQYAIIIKKITESINEGGDE